jgi:pyruvate/2-oxoglutarate/acetoin dehydrogenase E1 component
MTTKTMTFREALNDALRVEMERDPSVIVMGEDVGRHGGARGVSRGLWDRFGPERVIDTPISELAISGAAVGLAMSGFRPVVENYIGDIIMFMADSLVTSASKLHFSTSGHLNAPLVVRGADASRPDGGPHQDTMASWFAQVPGLKVVVPATPADAKGLLASSIRDDNPVVFLEPFKLYDTEGPVPEGEYTVPIGKAEVRAEGTDLTIVAVGGCLPDAMEARERWLLRGVSIEVVDPRSLRPLDTETIRRSVRKTGKLIVVHEGWTTYGIGAEIIACVCDGTELLLTAPAQRIGTLETHLPASLELTRAVLPSAERIDEAITKAMDPRQMQATRNRAGSAIGL